jgi:hypothetical protein
MWREELGVDKMIILKWSLVKWNERVWIVYILLRVETIKGFLMNAFDIRRGQRIFSSTWVAINLFGGALLVAIN